MYMMPHALKPPSSVSSPNIQAQSSLHRAREQGQYLAGLWNGTSLRFLLTLTVNPNIYSPFLASEMAHSTS